MIRKSITAMFYTITLGLTLSACSEQKEAEPNNQTIKNTEIKPEKPNKFKVAAIHKVKMANQGMSEQQATCVVNHMTAEGQVGLGEINQMKTATAEFSTNSNVLQSSYTQAIQACK